MDQQRESDIRALADRENEFSDALSELLQMLDVTRKALRHVTNGVLQQKVLRSSCEVSSDGIYRVHLREYDWDRLYALCKDTEVEIL